MAKLFFFLIFLPICVYIIIYIIYDAIKYPRGHNIPLPPIKKEYTEEDYDAFAIVAKIKEDEAKKV